MSAQLALFVRDGAGAFLLFGAVTKVVDWTDSVAALAGHFGLRRSRRLLPTLVAGELIVGTALIIGFKGRFALLAAGAIFGLFTVVVARWSAKGVDTPCGCFGLGIPSRSSWLTTGRNAVLAVTTALTALLANQNDGLSAGVHGHSAIAVIAASLAVPLVASSLGALDTIRATRHARERAWRPV